MVAPLIKLESAPSAGSINRIKPYDLRLLYPHPSITNKPSFGSIDRTKRIRHLFAYIILSAPLYLPKSGFLLFFFSGHSEYFLLRFGLLPYPRPLNASTALLIVPLEISNSSLIRRYFSPCLINSTAANLRKTNCFSLIVKILPKKFSKSELELISLTSFRSSKIISRIKPSSIFLFDFFAI